MPCHKSENSCPVPHCAFKPKTDLGTTISRGPVQIGSSTSPTTFMTPTAPTGSGRSSVNTAEQ